MKRYIAKRNIQGEGWNSAEDGEGGRERERERERE